MILNADCIEYMKGLEDNHYDIILTSPPFKDEDVEGDYWTWYDTFINECRRVSKYVTIIIHSATKMNEHITKYPPKRTLIWGKGVVMYSWRYNPIYVYEKNDYKINPHIWSDCIGVQPIDGQHKTHPYEDPVKLYQTILSMFSDLHTVLDPCAGSGTTLIAGRMCGMDVDCVEVGKGRCECIKKRAAAMQLSLGVD